LQLNSWSQEFLCLLLSWFLQSVQVVLKYFLWYGLSVRIVMPSMLSVCCLLVFEAAFITVCGEFVCTPAVLLEMAETLHPWWSEITAMYVMGLKVFRCFINITWFKFQTLQCHWTMIGRLYKSNLWFHSCSNNKAYYKQITFAIHSCIKVIEATKLTALQKPNQKYALQQVECKNTIKFMISAFVVGEFWSKKSNTPLGSYEGLCMCNLSDFKLHKDRNSTFNKSGTKERT
jgi:hypothetical protein